MTRKAFGLTFNQCVVMPVAGQRDELKQYLFRGSSTVAKMTQEESGSFA